MTEIKEYNFEEYNNTIDNINFNFIIKFSSIKENELIKKDLSSLISFRRNDELWKYDHRDWIYKIATQSEKY